MPRRSLILLAIIYLGYISLGLPDGTMGVAWPQMHVTLGLPIGLAGLLVFIGLSLSAFSGFSSGRVAARFSSGPVVLGSCLLTGSALVGISQAQSFAWLVAMTIPLGLGAGAVDASMNGYVAKHYTGRQMNWLHACWGIGATLGPLIVSHAIATGSGWRGGYLTLGSMQLCLAVLFFLTLPLWSAVPERAAAPAAAETPRVMPTARAHSEAGWLSVAIFALYVAVESTAGIWAASILVVGRGIPQDVAGICAAAYYGSITLGRIGVGVVVDRWGNRRLVTFGTLFALVGALGFVFSNSAWAAGVSLVVMGLGFAPIYPGLMHEVPRRFTPSDVQTVIGRQSGAGSVGAALLPTSSGWLAEVSLNSITWVIVAGVLTLFLAIRRLDRIS